MIGSIRNDLEYSFNQMPTLPQDLERVIKRHTIPTELKVKEQNIKMKMTNDETAVTFVGWRN